MAQFGGHVPPITVCPKFKASLQTNGDRVRAMTDRELAQFITYDFCEVLCGSPSICHGNCEEKMLEWLKEEVKDV